MDHCYDVSVKKDFEELQADEILEEEQLIDDDDCTVTLSVENNLDDIELYDIEIDKPGSHNFYIKLIDLVRSHTCIYDKFDPNFKSPFEKEKAWQQIASSLRTSVDFAQNRWTRMREKFAREKRIMENSRESDAGKSKRKQWAYFLPMLFLSSHVKQRHFRSANMSVDSLTADKTVSINMAKYLAEMGGKLVEDSTGASSSSVSKEMVDAGVTKKRKIEPHIGLKLQSQLLTPQAQHQRRIVAKPEEGMATVLLTSKNNDLDNNCTKLPPGVVILKNPQGSVGNDPLVLVPVTSQTNVFGKPGSIPMILSTSQQPNFNQANSESFPIPNSAEHHFGMLIAKELERFPKEVRAKKKQRILMVLYE